MLGHFHALRLALTSSPTREQREVFFASRGSKDPLKPEKDNQGTERTNQSADTASKETQKTIARTEQAVTGEVQQVLQPQKPSEDASRSSLDAEPGTGAGVLKTREDIARIAARMHKRMEETFALLENLRVDDVKVLDHGIINTPLFSLRRHMEDIRERIQRCIERGMIKDADIGETAMPDLRQTGIDVARLGKFSEYLGKTRIERGPLEMKTSLIIDDPSRPSRVRGYYDRGNNLIYVNSNETPETQKNVRIHEIGHAIWNAVEQYVNPDPLKRILDEQNQAIDDDVSLEEILRSPERKETLPPNLTQKQLAEKATDIYLSNRYMKGSLFLKTDAPRDERLCRILERNSDALKHSDETFSKYVLESPENLKTFAEKEELPSIDFEKELQKLGEDNADEVIRPVYEQCKADRRKRLLLLLERFMKWKDGKLAEFAERGGTEASSVREHELFGFLNRSYENFVRQSTLEAAERIRTKAHESRLFDNLLLRLSTGKDAMTQYMPYGADKVAILEELLNRYVDFRDGRDRETFTNPHELCLLKKIDPSLDVSAILQNDDYKRFIDEGETEVADAALPRTEQIKKNRMRYQNADEETDPKAKLKEKPVFTDEVVLDKELKWLSADITDMVGIAEKTSQTLRSRGNEQQAEEWETGSTLFASAKQSVNAWIKANTLIMQWRKKPRISPAEFRRLAPLSLDLQGGSYEEFENMIGEAAINGSEWHGDEDPRMQKLNGKLEEILKEIKRTSGEWQEKINDLRMFSRDIHDQDKQEGGMRIKWYSLRHIIDGVTKVASAYKKAWEQWSTLRTTEVANFIGRSLKGVPLLGEQAKTSLDMELDHANDEIKDEFKKHLEHDLADFDHCSQSHPGHPSMLEQFKKDPNKFRGVLEYMASKGWLYDFKVVEGTAFDMTIMDKLPPTWNEERKKQYLRDLEQQNSKGEEDSMSAGKSRVNNYPDIPPMIDVLYDELDRKNYWATYGILERIVEKGKLSHSPVWASVVILDRIRKDPDAQKYFPKKLLDKFGNNGLPNGMIHRFFKLDRHGIEQFQKNPNMPFDLAGDFPSIYMAIEHEMVSRQKNAGLPALDRKVLLNNISKVLAGQLVQGANNAWAVHIYENLPAFKKYRKYLEEFDSSVNPSDIDDDYYNPKNEGSELHLNSRNTYNIILNVASQGKFEHENKAKMFLEQLIKNFGILKKAADEGDIDRSVFVNFVRATREKLDDNFRTWTLGNAEQIIEYKGTQYPPGRYLFLELVRCRLLSPPEVKTNAKNALDKQIKAAIGNPDFYWDKGADLI